MIDPMNSRAGGPLKELSSEQNPALPFQLLTLFDSVESNAEASSASRLVLQELGEGVAVVKNAWDIRLLDSPILRGQASRQAANADVIVIALDSRDSDALLRQWAEEWQKSRSIEGGLLALIPCDDPENSRALEEFVQEVALCANMDFVCRREPRF